MIQDRVGQLWWHADRPERALVTAERDELVFVAAGCSTVVNRWKRVA